MSERYTSNEFRREPVLLAFTSPLSLSVPITFSDKDTSNVYYPHNDALVVTMPIGNCIVFRVLIDTGSNVNIMYDQVLDQMEATRRLHVR